MGVLLVTTGILYSPPGRCPCSIDDDTTLHTARIQYCVRPKKHTTAQRTYTTQRDCSSCCRHTIHVCYWQRQVQPAGQRFSARASLTDVCTRVKLCVRFNFWVIRALSLRTCFCFCRRLASAGASLVMRKRAAEPLLVVVVTGRAGRGCLNVGRMCDMDQHHHGDHPPRATPHRGGCSACGALRCWYDVCAVVYAARVHRVGRRPMVARRPPAWRKTGVSVVVELVSSCLSVASWHLYSPRPAASGPASAPQRQRARLPRPLRR